MGGDRPAQKQKWTPRDCIGSPQVSQKRRCKKEGAKKMLYSPACEANSTGMLPVVVSRFHSLVLILNFHN
jgi:hypothetical protein